MHKIVVAWQTCCQPETQALMSSHRLSCLLNHSCNFDAEIDAVILGTCHLCERQPLQLRWGSYMSERNLPFCSSPSDSSIIDGQADCMCKILGLHQEDLATKGCVGVSALGWTRTPVSTGPVSPLLALPNSSQFSTSFFEPESGADQMKSPRFLQDGVIAALQRVSTRWPCGCVESGNGSAVSWTRQYM
jgi:hypothetical protein